MLGEARQAPDDVGPPPCPRLRGGGDADQHERDFHRHGDVHLRPHRADGGDEIDHPADLGLGLRVIERFVLGPVRKCEQALARGAAFRRHPPQLLGDERREWMQQLEDVVAHPGGHRPRLVLGRAIGALQYRLCQLEVPVAEDVPHEAIGRSRRLVEPVGLDRLGDLACGLLGLVRDPAVERLLHRLRVEARHGDAMVHLGEAAGVPELGREIPVALDALRRQLDVAALRGHGREREAQRVGAVFVDQLERIDDVAFRLRHLGAVLVAHQRVDVDGAERHLLHEMQAHHHHARDPEEDDVEAGHQRIGRVKAGELVGLVRPAQGRERPERRGEPGVEHVLVAPDREPGRLVAVLRRVDLLQGLAIAGHDHHVVDAVILARLRNRLLLRDGDEGLDHGLELLAAADEHACPAGRR